jgi:hypothetical protein
MTGWAAQGLGRSCRKSSKNFRTAGLKKNPRPTTTRMMKMAKGKMWRRGMFMLNMILSLRLRMRNLSVLRELVILESFLDKKTYVISIEVQET